MMSERKKGSEKDVERVRDDARHDLNGERQRLEREREALEEERRRLERLQEELEARREHLEELEDELDDHADELEDADSIKEVLTAVSQGIGGVVRGIQEAVYSPKQSKQMAQSIAEFYKTLVDAGVPDHQAQALTHTHLANLQQMLRRTAHVGLPDFPRPPVPPEMEEGPPHKTHGPWPHSSDHAERET